MQYVPYGPELEGIPNVIVDGRGNAVTTLELSHWPRSRTPAELKADTSAEIVLNCLRSPKRDEYLGSTEAVSNNHYDIDGLIALWALLHPNDALARADLLVAVAECGDFTRWSGELAAKVTCALDGLERSDASPPRGAMAATGSFEERTAVVYRNMLQLLPRLLDDVDAFEDHWRDEFARVEAGRALFAIGEASLKEQPELDLAVFTIPGDVHTMALYEQTHCSRVVLVMDEQRYQVRYRYESWVELQTGSPPARVDLRPFADLLQTFEGNDGDWIADDVAQPTPRMRLRAPAGETSSSSITSGLFVRLLSQYLRDNAANEPLLWTPASADEAALAELPSD